MEGMEINTLIGIKFSGQYFSTSASNNRTGLQLCLWNVWNVSH